MNTRPSIHRRLARITATLSCALVAACSTIECDLAIPLAISLEVRDMATKQGIATGTIAVVDLFESGNEFSTIDTLRHFGDTFRLHSSGVGPGTYRVRVMHPGYQSYTFETVNVRASNGDCGGMLPTLLSVDLVRDDD